MIRAGNKEAVSCCRYRSTVLSSIRFATGRDACPDRDAVQKVHYYWSCGCLKGYNSSWMVSLAFSLHN